jgi:hypothetical protein
MEKLETDKRLLQQKLEQPDQSINSNHTVRILLTNFFHRQNIFALVKKFSQEN